MKNKTILALVFLLFVYSCVILGENNNYYKNQEIRINEKNLQLSSPIEPMRYLWNRTWGGNDWECAYAITLDSFEDVYLTGYTESYGAILSDAFLMKYDSTGTRQWNYTWGGFNDEVGWDLAIDSLNNIYVTGSNNTGWPDGDLFLLKYENIALPSLQWNRTWGGNTWDEGIAIALDSSDNIYIGGQTDSFGMGFPYTDFCLLKYNSAGVKQWNMTWGGPTDDACFAMEFDASKNLYLGGPASSFGAGDPDMCIVKLGQLISPTTIIPGYNILFLLGIISVVSLILVKKR